MQLIYLYNFEVKKENLKLSVNEPPNLMNILLALVSKQIREDLGAGSPERSLILFASDEIALVFR